MLRVVFFTLFFTSFITNAGIIFSEDFESGLNVGATENWNRSKSAYLTQDPLNSANNVLTFGSLIAGGDLFSNLLTSTTNEFVLSFDYLGNCQTDNCGGFLWNSITGWVGTDARYPDLLIDDGAWHTYSFTLSGSTMQLALEDWVGSGGTTKDVFFDNIVVTDSRITAPVGVPEPSSLMMFSLALIVSVLIRRKSKLNKS